MNNTNDEQNDIKLYNLELNNKPNQRENINIEELKQLK